MAVSDAPALRKQRIDMYLPSVVSRGQTVVGEEPSYSFCLDRPGNGDDKQRDLKSKWS